MNDNSKTFEFRATSLAALALIVTTAALPQQALSAPFQNGSFVMYRVGAETGARKVYIDEFGADGRFVQNAVALSDSPAAPFAAGTTKSEGLLTRSADGRCLAVPGYALTPGATDASKSTTTVAQRAVVLVDFNGVPGTPTPLGSLAFDQDSIRSAASADCSGFWASGKSKSNANSGVWQANVGGTPTLINNVNAHGLAIANQQLHVGNGADELDVFSSALPTSAATLVKIANIPAGTYRGIAFATLNAGSQGADTLYLADNGGLLLKFVRTGADWAARGSVTVPKIHGLVAMPTGAGNALLYAADLNGKLFQLFDTSGAQGVLNGSPIDVTPSHLAAGESFYGLALAPEPAPAANAPGAPTTVRMGQLSGNSGTLQWSAPATGPQPAFYVVELSRDAFATIDQSAVATGTSATLSNLQKGQSARVRAVNGIGGSPSAAAAPFVIGNPPTATLADNTAYSGVVGDTHDELATRGIRFTVSDPAGGAARVSVAGVSSATSVISRIETVNDGGNVTLKLVPQGVGYADITLTITGASGASISRTIRYAASAPTAATAGTRWFAGRSDASSALIHPITGAMIVVDDEAPAQDASANALPGGNAAFGYTQATGGLPVSTLVPDAALGLSNAASCSDSRFTGLAKCDADGEADLESSVLVGERMYFAGSHSNNKNGRSRPDRWRFFGVDAATGNVAGYYQWLREDLRRWDAGNAHGLGADYLGLVSSSDGGDKNPLKAPETDTLSGFSIEGSTTSPDDGQLWLGFRAPLVSAPGQAAVTPDAPTNRTHALIIPVGNYAGMLSASGGAPGSAQIGAPIRLDLGGRGIREIRKNASGDYLIIAGPPDGANGTAPRDFRLFSWDGRVSSAGLALNVRALAADVAVFTPPQSACSAEGIATLPAPLAQGGTATVISDCGDADFYGDKQAAKDLPFAAWKKFRSDEVRIAALPAAAVTHATSTLTGATFSAQSVQAGTLHAIVLPAQAPQPSWEQVAAGHDAADQPAPWSRQGMALAANQASTLEAAGLAADTAFVAYSVFVSPDGIAGLVTATPFRTSAQPPAVIDFPALPDRTLGSAPFTVTATGPAPGEAVQFASRTEGVCTTTGAHGATVTLRTVGTCTLRATQADAPAVERSFQVSMPATTGTTLPGPDGGQGTVSGGGWQFAANSAGSASSGALPPLPAGYRFVQSNGFGFVLAGGTVDGVARVTWQWTQPAPANAMLWKHGPTGANATPHWHDVQGQFDAPRTSASFSITDGGDGDEDGLRNGVIVDPVFLVAPANVAPTNTASVPTLSDAGRAMLALALAAMAAVGQSRRNR